MDDELIAFAQTQLQQLRTRLQTDPRTSTPASTAALARLRRATADLVAWLKTSPVGEPDDPLSTPLGLWVQAVRTLLNAMDPEADDDDDDDGGEEVFDLPPLDLPPDTPTEAWLEGLEALLAETARDQDTGEPTRA